MWYPSGPGLRIPEYFSSFYPCESQRLSPNYPQAGMLEGSWASRPLVPLVALPTWKGWGGEVSFIFCSYFIFKMCS